MWKVSIRQKGSVRAELSGLGPSPQLSADRLFNCWPLAELIEKHRSNAPSDRCDIESDNHWIGLGSDDHRIGLGLAGQPFEFEPE
jgi:hypothetical protein